MNRGNKCLMLIEQVIKVSEHKEKRSENDEMHCYFVSGCGSAVCLFQEKHPAANKFLYRPYLTWRKHFIASHLI